LSSLIEFSCVGRVEAVKAVCLSQYGYNARLFQAVNFESMTYKYTMLALAFTVLAACERSAPPPDLAAEAQRIANESIIVDTHIDVPYRLDEAPADVSRATDGGDFDYPRARAGGLNAAFMSIYTPAKLEAEGQSREIESGIMSLSMGMENGSPLEGDLANLQHYYDRGIRYITLVHSLSNHISDSSFDENRQWNGLSEFGVEVVREMNRLGIMVDVSHVSDEAFWQVLDISAVPVIASHSSARHFTPGWERNMSDEMITALANNGGIIMINFGSAFITEEARQYSSQRWPASRAYIEEHSHLPRAEAQRQFAVAWEAEHGPMPYASLDDVLDHFDHVVGLVGIDHVGIGSDYDGVGDSLPTDLKDASAYPNLIEGLLRRGYSEADIRKILGENLLRVWQSVEDYAATTSTST
jgi:membrane dipeptidase